MLISNLVQRGPLAGEKIAVFGKYFVLYALAVVPFAVTLTFLPTTPMVYEASGFPQLSPMPGQFLAKDLLLLAAAIWIVGDSLAA